MTISPFHAAGIEARPGPRYRAIADALRDAIKMGTLLPGTKLPPLRDLAYELGVTVGTVSRAYALAASRGEVSGEVGRGTFVLGAPTGKAASSGVGSAAFLTIPDTTQAAMKAAYAPPAGQTEVIRAVMTELLAEPQPQDAPSLFNSYLTPGGDARQREAAAAWLAHGDYKPQADELIICSGAQQGILAAILSATEPGDTILTEALTYQAMVVQATLLGRRVSPVDIDGEGIEPGALSRAASETRPAALFIVPTLQNPTSAIMSEERRREIAEIARRHEFAIIEDDVYGALAPERPVPIAHILPEQTYYVTSLAKSVGCGLRVGFLKPPAAMLERTRAINHAFGQTVPPLMARLATRLMENGDGTMLTGKLREEMCARHEIAAAALKGRKLAAHPASLYVWMALPDTWHAHVFVEAARARGVAIAAGEDFMVGRTDRASRHVRLAIGQPQSREELAAGLGIVSELLDAGPISSSLVA
ncbi:putative transcriptional regulator, GntR family [Parvibaculum lavamentivorans DS-1]|uniref:Putative transcriptional regulator, GntR family n=1 Tax=Parvibaculum lavamentivorans (strain DS-1 / DSM 13023 / NCIMB 13966) TaxID=402881 RepID=A7HV14_PARL1|nr:PLP-dependent aminotransferase family protein [Parvibaculum lavamentivorans]ABS63747.1 putative transcriptional regulator, GntR family [Parvibaculum lavamentivorans DS-1]